MNKERVSMNAADILIAAREKITPEGTWIKGRFASIKSARAGSGCWVDDPRASSFCGLGAVCNVAGRYHDHLGNVVRLLNRCAQDRGFENYPKFNDAPETKHSDVLELFVEAIELAKAT